MSPSQGGGNQRPQHRGRGGFTEGTEKKPRRKRPALGLLGDLCEPSANCVLRLFSSRAAEDLNPCAGGIRRCDAPLTNSDLLAAISSISSLLATGKSTSGISCGRVGQPVLLAIGQAGGAASILRGLYAKQFRNSTEEVTLLLPPHAALPQSSAVSSQLSAFSKKASGCFADS